MFMRHQPVGPALFMLLLRGFPVAFAIPESWFIRLVWLKLKATRSLRSKAQRKNR